MKSGHNGNVAASYFARLKNLADTHQWNFNHLQVRYATERFLFRLSSSRYARSFILKGGNLFVIWQNGDNSRPTMDSDLLCFGNSTPEHLRKVFTELAEVDSLNRDGMRYDASSLEVAPIREETEYGGTRITLYAYLGNARIRMQFDIGVGDAVTPSPEAATYPVLLDGENPRLLIYPMATAIAEKTEVMVSRGILNSRMKDFYDVWLMSKLATHSYSLLRQAIINTFERRGVQLPNSVPESFTPQVTTSPAKIAQWKAFIRRHTTLDAPQDFREINQRVAEFVLPLLVPPDIAPDHWEQGNGWVI